MSDNPYNIGSSTKQKQKPPPAAAPSIPWSVTSILAVICPFLCLFPAGLLFGIMGVIATKEGAAKGRVLAIVGLVLSSLQLGFIVLAVAVAPDDGPITKENAHERADQLEREVDADIRANP